MRFITNVLSIRLLLVLLLCGICINGLSSAAMATPADLDLSFGSGGKVFSSPEGTQSTGAFGIALQADGKIILAGGRLSGTGNLGFVVARYNADGSLDLTFGGGDGWVSTLIGDYASAASVAIQSDGKIVVGGTTALNINNVPFVYDFAVVRYNPDGSLDTTFDTDGKATVSFNEAISSTELYNDFFRSLKIAPDGKIIIAGYSQESSFFKARFILGRLNSDGSLDTTFGTNGRVVNPQLGWNDTLNDMIVLPDGSIVVAGHSNGASVSDPRTNHLAVKYNVNGGTQWTYQQTFMRFATEALDGVAAQPDGKLVFVGKLNGKVFAMRLNANGTVDNSFNNPTGMPTVEALSVALQTDGKIVATFTTNTSGGINGKFSVVRFNADGSLDTGFNGSGFVHTTVIPDMTHIGRVVIQPDGKILVGGYLRQTSVTYFAMVRYMGGSLVGPKPLFDFDGDGKADLGVFRGSNGTWYLQRSSAGELIQNFGLSGDRVAAADYDGDFKTDLAIYRNGDWWYLNSSNGTVGLRSWGTATDTPLPSDFDADGKADFIYYRPSTGQWFRSASTGATSTIQFGIAGDIPLIADIDGDGKTEPTIFRPSTGTWWYKSSVTGIDTAIQWGQNGDVPVPGDYDADGKTDTAVFRPSNGVWYILNSGGAYTATSWGLDGDKPVAADYDGDGKTDIAIWRPSTGVWYILQSTAGFTGMQYGLSTDKPVENAFLP